MINPDQKSILVDHKPEPDKLLKITDNLDGKDIFPGLTLAVADLLIEWDF